MISLISSRLLTSAFFAYAAHSRALPTDCIDLPMAAGSVANPPYPYCNWTTPRPTPLNNTNGTPVFNSSCPFQTVHPSELRHMNSLYETHEYNTTNFFMALREDEDAFQVGTQVQFANVSTDSQPCALVLHLPGDNETTIRGLSPSLNVYQVEREAGTPTPWTQSIFAEKGINIAAGNANITGAAPANVSNFAVGTVNGDPPALELVRKNNGTVVVGYVKCNETLTFHIGMARPGMGPTVHYWDFMDVPPGATPDQGWRIVWAPNTCDEE